MADAPWRCTQCGTVNEPAANACRTCGRWPSLFDLERSSIDVEADEEAPEVDVRRYETMPGEIEDLTRGEPAPVPDVEAGEEEPGGGRGRRSWASFIVPLAFVVYLVISILSDR